MEFKELEAYERWQNTLAIYPEKGKLLGLTYVGLKLAGEAGEFADKVGKVLRDKGGVVDGPTRMSLLLELGDALWYISAAARELRSNLEEVACLNHAKLESRRVRGTLGGEGDDR